MTFISASGLSLHPMAPSLLQAPRRSAHAIVALSTAADLGCCASSTTPPPHLHRPRRRRVRPAGLRPDIMDDDAFLISPHQRDARTMILAPGVTLTHPGLIPQTISSSVVGANDFAENGSKPSTGPCTKPIAPGRQYMVLRCSCAQLLLLVRLITVPLSTKAASRRHFE